MPEDSENPRCRRTTTCSYCPRKRQLRCGRVETHDGFHVTNDGDHYWSWWGDVRCNVPTDNDLPVDFDDLRDWQVLGSGPFHAFVPEAGDD